MKQRQLGPYDVVSRIGRGASSHAYLAERRGMDGFAFRVCLKVALIPDDEPGSVQTFVHEARIAAALKHPYIVACHELGEDDGYWWMAMDLVEGVDLKQLLNVLDLDGERMPVEVGVYIAMSIADALDYAHTFKFPDGTPGNVVHRDVKPSNVMLGLDGVARLTDFGIAKHSSAAKTSTGLIKGTIPYMSPEQSAQDRDLDGRSDLFSLGVMLFEMVAGKRPFDGADDLITLANVGRCRFTARLPESTPEDLKRAISALLQQQRDRRSRTGLEVLETIAAVPASGRARAMLKELVRRARDRAGPILESSDLTQDRDDTVLDPTKRTKG